MLIIIVGDVTGRRTLRVLLLSGIRGAAGVAMRRGRVHWRGKLTKLAKIGHDLRRDRNAILSCAYTIDDGGVT